MLALDNVIGNFTPGKQFDAVIVDPYARASPFDIYDRDTLEDIVQKYLLLGDSRNVSAVYVAGVKVWA